jgi:hypothetical protein
MSSTAHRSNASSRKFRRAAAAVCAAAALLGGCLDSWQRPTKAPVSMLWLGRMSPALEGSDVARLKDAGVGELIVRVGTLDLDSDDGPIVRDPADSSVSLPLSVPVTLALGGSFHSADPETAAARVVAAADQLRFELEGRGSLPVGLHFDLDRVGTFLSYGAFLSAVRKELDKSLFLSASLQRDWVREAEVGEIARAVDFVVPFLYGQRIEEPEDGEAWDFVELERKLRILEEIGSPYMLGVVVLGTATYLGGDSRVKARRTALSLQEILWNRDLKLRPGFSLEGVNRRVYGVVAERKTRVGSWELANGEGIRVVRAATSDLEELMRLLGAWELPHHLGQVYYRLPAEDERLSLSFENLLNALDTTPATPELQFDVSLQRRTGRGWLVRLSITNLNGEITELSLMDSNYLQARCLNGTFGQRIRTGDFYRYDLFRLDGDELERTFRSPDVLRLQLPILEGQQRVESGDVEVLVSGQPRLELLGQFLLPDGRRLTVGPVPWPPEPEAG